MGADLNRNFPTTAWGYYTTSKNDDPKESSMTITSVPRAASEAETGAVVVFCSKYSELGVSIDYHSTDRQSCTPQRRGTKDRMTPEYQILGTMMQEITGNYRLGPPRTDDGLRRRGPLMDFASSFPQMPSFTIEMSPA